MQIVPQSSWIWKSSSESDSTKGIKGAYCVGKGDHEI